MRASKCGMARQGRGIAEHVKAGQGRERQPGAGWTRQACKQANYHVQIAYALRMYAYIDCGVCIGLYYIRMNMCMLTCVYAREHVHVHALM